MLITCFNSRLWCALLIYCCARDYFLWFEQLFVFQFAFGDVGGEKLIISLATFNQFDSFSVMCLLHDCFYLLSLVVVSSSSTVRFPQTSYI